MEKEEIINENKIKYKFGYYCKRCRTKLFEDDNIQIHEPGRGQKEFLWKKKIYFL
jgi:hypothetical protein